MELSNSRTSIQRDGKKTVINSLSKIPLKGQKQWLSMNFCYFNSKSCPGSISHQTCCSIFPQFFELPYFTQNSVSEIQFGTSVQRLCHLCHHQRLLLRLGLWRLGEGVSLPFRSCTYKDIGLGQFLALFLSLRAGAA